ncbi:MAG TPA: DnaJ domain-containing protein [Acidimicrobiia bacterium]|nr:DnaJ domain-containing protein [Acidimicrobiia bacterium]
MGPGNSTGDGRHSDYYDVLGVPPSATDDDITRAYRRLVRQHHPDHNPAAESKRFQEITDAYGVIGDAERRRRYDAEQHVSPAGQGVKIPVRGPGRAASGPPEQGGDRAVIRLPAELAASGTIVVVDVTEETTCSRCAGSGLERPAGSCSTCGGEGSLTRRTGQIPVRHICRSCGGRGRPTARACPACSATGTVTSTRPLKVRVPPGVRDGARLRIRRPGAAPTLEARVRLV